MSGKVYIDSIDDNKIASYFFDAMNKEDWLQSEFERTKEYSLQNKCSGYSWRLTVKGIFPWFAQVKAGSPVGPICEPIRLKS